MRRERDRPASALLGEPAGLREFAGHQLEVDEQHAGSGAPEADGIRDAIPFCLSLPCSGISSSRACSRSEDRRRSPKGRQHRRAIQSASARSPAAADASGAEEQDHGQSRSSVRHAQLPDGRQVPTRRENFQVRQNEPNHKSGIPEVTALPCTFRTSSVRNALKPSKSLILWCTRLDSNQWPLPSEGSALSS